MNATHLKIRFMHESSVMQSVSSYLFHCVLYHFISFIFVRVSLINILSLSLSNIGQIYLDSLVGKGNGGVTLPFSQSQHLNSN